MKKISILLFLHLPLFVSAQKKARGLEFNDMAYQKIQVLSPSLKWESNSVAASLKKFCPIPGNQYPMGSCVGWACGYSALTISWAENANITDKNQITALGRSALYIYNQIKISDCDSGANIVKAMQFLITNGDCLKSDFNPPNCNIMPAPDLQKLASDFRIKEYHNVFGLDASPDQKIVAAINSIDAHKPLVIGMLVPNSFDDLGQPGDWNPGLYDTVGNGGHALCLIGYNNITERFEIMNSWGTDWGNNGFFTMSYKDFGRLVRYGMQFSLQNTEEATIQALVGNFRFKKYKGYDASADQYQYDEVPVQLNGTNYTIPDEVHVNDYFRLVADSITADKYVYIMSLKPDGKLEALFPEDNAGNEKVTALVPSSKARIEIPVDEKRGLRASLAGDDLLCILYSSEPLDFKKLTDDIRTGTGEFYDRLQRSLGNRLIPFSDINYNPSTMGFNTASKNGTVVPVILKVKVKE